MARTVNGRLIAAPDKPIGDALAVDHPAGSVTLEVSDTFGFDEAGGLLRVGAEEIAYTGYDDDAATIFLDVPTTADALEGDPVIRLPEVFEKTVMVRIAEDSGSREVAVRAPFYMHPMIDEAIRSNLDGSYARLREIDGEYELVDLYGIPKKVDASSLTGALPSDLGQDDTAPEASPTAIVTPAGVGGVRVSWTPVPWARFYDVYASLDSGVTTASTFVGTSTGSTHTFDSLDGVRLPSDDSDVYAAIVARNDAGAAPIGAEGSSTTRKADIDELNVEQLNANIIDAITGIFGALNVEIAFIGGRLTLGNVEGAHIVLDPAVGLVFYDIDGQTVLGKLDITSAQASMLSLAVVTAAQARITNLELYGQMSRIMNGGILELLSGVASPEQPPSLTAALGSRPWIAAASGYTECGMFYEESSGYWWQMLYRADANRLIVRAVDAAGEKVGSDIQLRNIATVSGVDRGVDVANGLVKIGGYFYVLRRRKEGAVGARQWLLIRYVTTGDPAPAFAATVAGTENSPGSVGSYPTVGVDNDSELVVASLSTTCSLAGMPTTSTGFVRYNLSLTRGAIGQWTGDIGNGLYARGCGITNLSEYGGTRFWVAHTSRVYFFTGLGTTLSVDTAHPWFDLDGTTTVTARGATVDGARFHSSAGTTSLKVYSDYLDAGDDSRTFWAQYAWESGADATTPSPAESFVLPDRRYLTIGLPQRASGTTVTRVFTGRGATEPARTAMYSRGTTAGASIQVASHVTSGENPRTDSDFTEGTPGLLRSKNGEVEIWGDGTIHVPDPLMPTDAANKQYVDALEARVAALESA